MSNTRFPNTSNHVEAEGEEKGERHSSREIQNYLKPITITKKDIPHRYIQRMKVIDDKFLMLCTTDGQQLSSYNPSASNYNISAVHIFSLDPGIDMGRKIISIRENDSWNPFAKRKDFFIRDFLYHKKSKKLIFAGELESSGGMALRIYDKSPLSDETLSKPIKGLPYKANERIIDCAFLCGKYMVVGTSYRIVVLDIDRNFLEVSSVTINPNNSDKISNLAVLPNHNIIAYGYSIDLYHNICLCEYDVNGNIEIKESWEPVAVSFSCDFTTGPLILTALNNDQLASSDASGNMIYVWDIDHYLSNKDKPLERRLKISEKLRTGFEIKNLLSLSDNLLCAHYFDGTVAIWNWDRKRQREIANYRASQIAHFGHHLVLLESNAAGWKVRFENIEHLGGNHQGLLIRQLGARPIEFFMQRLKTKLESYYAGAKALDSGLLKKNVNLISEKRKSGHYIETVEAGIEMVSGLWLIASVCSPSTVSASEIFHEIYEIIDAVEKYGIATVRIFKGLPLIYTTVVRCFREQHGLDTEKLIANLREAFDDQSSKIFIHYIIQHFAWRYWNQVDRFDSEMACKLGDELAERVAEPFALGMCRWEDDIPFMEVIKIVNNWVYYAANLPFVIKRTKSLPDFLTAHNEKMSLSEILSPAGFEVQDEKGNNVHIEVESAVRILNDALQEHIGGKREISVPEPRVKSYCRATEAEIEQIKEQAAKIREHRRQAKNLPSSSVRALTRLNFLSQSSRLPFVIKDESVDLIGHEIKAISCEIKDDDIARLNKKIIGLEGINKQKDAEIVALRSKNESLEGSVTILQEGLTTLRNKQESLEGNVTILQEGFTILKNKQESLEDKIAALGGNRNDAFPLRNEYNHSTLFQVSSTEAKAIIESQAANNQPEIKI